MSDPDLSLRIIIQIVGVLVVVVLLVITYVIIRRMQKKLTVQEIDELSMAAESLKCPKCQKYLENGFSLAPRGIFWRELDFGGSWGALNIGKSLNNTINMGFTQKYNRAWRCTDCELIVIDHSAMLRIKKRG